MSSLGLSKGKGFPDRTALVELVAGVPVSTHLVER